MERREAPLGPVQIEMLARIAEKGFWRRGCGWNVTNLNGRHTNVEEICRTLCGRRLLVFTRDAAGRRVYTLPGKGPSSQRAPAVEGKE